MHGMTTLAHPINFLWMGLAFFWFPIGVCFVETTVLSSGCLVGL